MITAPKRLISDMKRPVEYSTPYSPKMYTKLDTSSVEDSTYTWEIEVMRCPIQNFINKWSIDTVIMNLVGST